MYGCLNPDIVADNEHQHRYKVEYAPIEKTPSIIPSIQAFNKKYKALNSDVSSYKSFEFENLDLNLSRILILNRENNLKSYSVSIINTQSQEPEYCFDNLHIVETTGEDVVFIFRWIPQDRNVPFDLSNYTGRLKKFDVHYNLISEHSYVNGLIQNSTSGNSKYALLCYPYMECSCSGDPYYCGCTNSKCPVVVNTNCSLTYVGGGGEEYEIPSGDGGGGSGSGGAGDGNDGSIGDNGDPLHPVIPIVLEDITDPCVKLKGLFAPYPTGPNIKSIIQNQLQTDIPINPNGEKGASLIRNSAGVTGSSIIPPTISNEIEIPAGGFVYCAIHTHPNSAIPMFSWSDVYTLYTINKNISPHNQGLASFLLVCKDDYGVFQTYAVVFNNQTANVIDMVLNSPGYAGMTGDKIAILKDNELKKKFKEEEDNDKNYERAFLRQMLNTDISLYKANSSLANWNRLELNQTTNTTTGIPCN